VNIPSKNGAISVSIARIGTDAKADARVPIAVPFSRASTQAMKSQTKTMLEEWTALKSLFAQSGS
jgi:hypothetical protein